MKRTSVDHQLHPIHVSQRAKSESPRSALPTVVTTASAAVVHRTATAPAFSNDTPSITGAGNSTSMIAAPVTTQPAVTTVTGGRDVSLMSTLLRALRSYSTTPTNCQTSCHGSPVMLLKDLIDTHFSNAMAAAAMPSSSHVSPVTNAANPTNRVCIQSVLSCIVAV